MAKKTVRKPAKPSKPPSRRRKPAKANTSTPPVTPRGRRRVDPAKQYAAKKEAERERNAEKSRLGRDLGELPPPADPKRRARAEKSLRVFLETYFEKDFPLPWSDDHLTLIREIELRILVGGLKSFAMPRGTGKTTICERAAIFAVVNGHRHFVALIGAIEEAGEEMLETIKFELEENDLLCDDYPEVCIPIRMLHGIVNRAKGQHINGRRTRIGWKGKSITLPTIDGSKSSGATIAARGLLGRVRGMKRKVDGRTIRPDVVLLDDAQTDQSARNPEQVTKRLKVLNGAILGLGGPGVKIAVMLPITVIEPGDVADQLLDREKNPQWDGFRTRMLYGTAANPELIEKYWELRAEDLRTKGNDAQAFYRKNQRQLEAGLRAAWSERKEPDDISAIQHALNLKQDRGGAAFDAEYQNDPPKSNIGDDWHIGPDEIATRLSGLARSVSPNWATRIKAHIDIQQRVLYYGVAAFDDAGNSRGSFIEYGTWPRQTQAEFEYRNIRNPLSKLYPRLGIKGAILAGLRDLVDDLLDRQWKREDGVLQRVDMVGIDAGNWTDLVHEFCRTNKRAALLMPTKGAGVTADKRPISEWRKPKGSSWIIGREWMLSPQPKHASRLLTFDTNFWKRELFIKLATPLGESGGMTLYGHEPRAHAMICRHFDAEAVSRTEGYGRTVHVFSEKPGSPDNHLFDTAVGCLVLTLPGLTRRRARRQGKVSYL